MGMALPNPFRLRQLATIEKGEHRFIFSLEWVDEIRRCPVFAGRDADSGVSHQCTLWARPCSKRRGHPRTSHPSRRPGFPDWQQALFAPPAPLHICFRCHRLLLCGARSFAYVEASDSPTASPIRSSSCVICRDEIPYEGSSPHPPAHAISSRSETPSLPSSSRMFFQACDASGKAPSTFTHDTFSAERSTCRDDRTTTHRAPAHHAIHFWLPQKLTDRVWPTSERPSPRLTLAPTRLHKRPALAAASPHHRLRDSRVKPQNGV